MTPPKHTVKIAGRKINGNHDGLVAAISAYYLCRTRQHNLADVMLITCTCNLLLLMITDIIQHTNSICSKEGRIYADAARYVNFGKSFRHHCTCVLRNYCRLARRHYNMQSMTTDYWQLLAS